jgi:hypothetical protein
MHAAPIRVAAGDSFERFPRHCRRYSRIFPRQYPRGVFKFHTIEEAQAARDRVSRDGSRATE